MMDAHDTNQPLNQGELEEEKKTVEVSEAITETPTEEVTAEVQTEAAPKPATKEDVLNLLKELAQNAENANKQDIDNLKQSFYKLHNVELEAAKKEFTDNGGAIEDFVPQEDPEEEEFKRLMGVIKEKRSKMAAELERQKEENLQVKLSIIEELKELVESGDDANKSYTEFKKLQQQWNETKLVPQGKVNELWKNYQLYVEKFYDLLKLNNEFREYDFKKNLEIKTHLCEAAEKLADEEDVVSAFHQLQKLHQEFRDTGPVAKELRDEIWNRFKAASTAVNRRHQQHFEALKETEQHNLDQKTVICEIVEAIEYNELKTFSAWENKTQEVIALQNKWKTIGFAPQKMNVKIFERFRHACDDFFKKKGEFFKSLKEGMNENLEKKKALCEKAEALKDSTDWKATADALTKLQKEWKTIGPVAKKHSDAVWKRFISACDYFFDQKNKATSSQRSVEVENMEKKKALIEKLSAIEENMDMEEASTLVRELMKEWNSIGHVPFKEKDKLYKQYHSLIDQLFDRFNINTSNKKLSNFRSNIRGGGRKVSYFLNAAVSNENGIIADIEQNPYDVKMNHQKYIFQSNVSANITKTTVVGIKVNAQLEYNTRPIEDIGNLFYYSMRANPVRFPATLPAEEGDTFVRYGNNASWDTGATDLNPLAKLSRGYGKRYYSYMTTAFTLDQNLDFFTKGLSANLTASFYNYTYSATYRTATPYYFKVEDGSSLNPDGTANLITNSIGDTGTTYLTSTDGNGGHRRYALQASLNYARKFGKHDVGAMFVYRMNEKKNNIAGTSEENLLPYREQGMAGRVTYGFDNRYLFEASFGYNGSENFAPGKRWGFFPSAAAGWVISNESFWDGIRKTVSNLKIRVSYGLAGNDALGERFPYRSIVAMGEESGFYYNWNSQGKGPKITTYGNPNATWEEAKKLDVGLELGLFNALNIEAAYFTEDRTGIFMRRTSLPSSTGLLGVTPYGNIGRVKSHGVDLSAVYNKQFNKDWSLSLRGTFTFSRNEVVEKDEGDLMYDYMSVVGHPVNAITGVLVADGLFTSQEEIDNSPKQQFGNYTVGDIKYRDLNGDGIVDGNDVTTAGSPTVPEIQYGIGATVKWRRLDFSFMFQGASNVSLRMYNMHPFCDASHFGYGITQYIADNHWSEDNNRADAAYPRLTSQLSSNNTQSSTFYIHDAKYLRLKTVELGYTIKKLRVYLSGNNLFVISPFDYWDPEKGGGHGLSYPLQRTAKIGVQYQF